MNITCKQDHLHKAIHAIGRITGKQTTLPILENILLETEKGQIKVTATNLEIGIVTYVGGKITTPGKIVIPTKIFGEFVGNLSSDSIITIEVEKQDIILSSDSHKARIQGFSVEDYPLIPKSEKPSLIAEFNAQTFKEGLTRAMVCVAVNNIRVEFTGVNMILQKDTSYLAATDSFRLIECIISQKSLEMRNNQEEENIIIPHKTVTEIIKLIDNSTKKVQFILEEGQIFINLDEDIFIVSRLINGKFPDYKQIIPKEYATQIVAQKDECMRSVRLSGLFSDIKSAEVLLKVRSKEKLLEFLTQSSQVGKNTSQLPIKSTGPDQDVLFNPRFIVDALNIVESEEVAIQLNDSASPAKFCGLKKDKSIDIRFQYILMPIKK